MTQMKKRAITFITVFWFVMVGGYLLLSHPTPINTMRDYLGKPEYMKLYSSKLGQEQRRLVEIGNRKFDLPLKYVDGQLNPNMKQSGVNFKYVLPDFKSLWDLRDREEYLRLFNEGKESYLLVQPSDAMPSIAVSASNLLKAYAQYQPIGMEGDLEKYEGYRIRKGKLILQEYFFLEKDLSGEIIGYIKCKVEETVASPGCSHNFVDASLRYNVYYNKKNYFQSWKKQKEKVVNFINNLEVTPNH